MSKVETLRCICDAGLGGEHKLKCPLSLPAKRLAEIVCDEMIKNLRENVAEDKQRH